ncbi:hypothetical protein [Clostridium felsineum]|uniref:Uncharacterized protein n=1 Tax=Clostridium felsineum TaxID=36839 RepID=A0A1S8KXJ2_9CLOT|nr:hypothetical protein [Clostridium felsineum]URZ01966.1 hypothetical protein CLAUR_019630 [Clostridium felsineum]URZ05216.1 hypothetical protein CLROS_005400 [Clostridium felsineum]URZ10257.1 hypothetical protein CROST_009650 [Clostridium felsineum]
MKFIVVDGRKLGAIIVVVGLMLVLFGIGNNFNDKIRSTAYIQSNLGQLKEYKVNELGLSYMLPEKWETETEKFSGGEILYHNNFTDKASGINGFVEVWNIKQDLKTFLNNSKNASIKQNVVENYKLQSVTMSVGQGYFVQYIIKDKYEKGYVANEYFIKSGKNFVRFAFYVEQDKYKSSMQPVFKAIVETLKYEKSVNFIDKSQFKYYNRRSQILLLFLCPGYRRGLYNTNFN